MTPTSVDSRPATIWYGLHPIVLFFSFIACSLPPSKVSLPTHSSARGRATQTGIASWYGPGFHGRLTASGVTYDQHELTAAHPTLPLGTRVMVTNLENGRSTEVAINDRGPFVKGRIIDLSYAAAQNLGMVQPGTIPVRLEVIDSGPYKIPVIPEKLHYTLQVGSFTDVENARRLRDQLAQAYPRLAEASIVVFGAQNVTYYRVQTGTFSDRREAEEHAQELTRRGFPVVIMER